MPVEKHNLNHLSIEQFMVQFLTLAIQRCNLRGDLDRDGLPRGGLLCLWPLYRSLYIASSSCSFTFGICSFTFGIRSPDNTRYSPLRKFSKVCAAGMLRAAFAGPWFRIVEIRRPTRVNSCSGKPSTGSCSNRSWRTFASRIGLQLSAILGSRRPTTASRNRCTKNPRTS